MLAPPVVEHLDVVERLAACVVDRVKALMVRQLVLERLKKLSTTALS